MNRNEMYYVMRVLHSSTLRSILRCSKDTSFLARILVIRDGDVEYNPGSSDIDFSIKKQRVDQRNLGLKENLLERTQVWFPQSQ